VARACMGSTVIVSHAPVGLRESESGSWTGCGRGEGATATLPLLIAYQPGRLNLCSRPGTYLGAVL
jgi:hypothetical protein